MYDPLETHGADAKSQLPMDHPQIQICAVYSVEEDNTHKPGKTKENTGAAREKESLRLLS